MKNNKIIFWILILLATGIWGTVTVRIIDYAYAIDASEVNSSIPHGTIPAEVEQCYIYQENIRDPFHFARVAHRKDSLSANTNLLKPAHISPPFRIIGIVVTGNRKIVTVEGTNGSVHFLRTGDTLAGMKIVNIHGQSVTYLYEERREKWVLQ